MAGRNPALVIAAILALGFCRAWLERSRRKTLVAMRREDRRTLLALERERKKTEPAASMRTEGRAGPMGAVEQVPSFPPNVARQ